MFLNRYILAATVATMAWPACGEPLPGAAAGRPVLALQDHPSWPPPPVGDGASIATLIAAFDVALSVPAGGRLDRAQLRRLFVPGGRIVIGVDPRPGRPADIALVTPDAYADLSDRQTARAGFFDRVVANGVERFGDMAHVYSTYESRHAPSEPKPFARGVKSFELLLSDGQWRIVQVFYERERLGIPIPKSWLKDRMG